MILTVTLNAAIDKRYVLPAFDKGEVNRVVSCRSVPGGKGLNVSKAASKAGADVLATGFVGGHAGEAITGGLEDYNVDEEFMRVPGESRSCVNIWEEDRGCQTELLEPGITIAPEDFDRFVDKFEQLAQNADVAVMSGSLPSGLAQDSYGRLIEAARRAGCRVVLDTSGQTLIEGIKAKPDLIKPNADEIRMLTGSGDLSLPGLIEAAKKVRGQGVDRIVISLGSEGSVLVCGEGVYRAVVPKIDAVNTVGCGDTMTAGLAIGLEQELSPEETLRMASAISAASAMSDETGMFCTEDYEELLPQIRIERLSD